LGLCALNDVVTADIQSQRGNTLAEVDRLKIFSIKNRYKKSSKYLSRPKRGCNEHVPSFFHYNKVYFLVSDNDLWITMFCPYCNRNIGDEEVFCPYCGKVQPTKNVSKTVVEPIEPRKMAREPEMVASEKAKKGRNNFRIAQVAITVIAIVVLVLVVFQLYYPSLLPWNW